MKIIYSAIIVGIVITVFFIVSYANKNMKRYKLIAFDLDGTLLDTSIDLTNAVNKVRSDNGYSLYDVDDVKMMVGNGIPTLIERAFPEITTQEERDELYKQFVDYYSKHSENTHIFLGMRQIVQTIHSKGYKVAIISNKNDAIVKELSETMFKGLPDYALGRTDNLPKKPAADMMNKVTEELGVSVKQTLYVGDSDVDHNFAKAAGCDCVLVSWGFRDRATLEKLGKDVEIVDKPADLFTYI